MKTPRHLAVETGTNPKAVRRVLRKHSDIPHTKGEPWLLDEEQTEATLELIRKWYTARGMLKVSVIALAIVASTGAAMAQTHCQQIGTQTFCNGPNGSSLHGQRIGNQDFWTGSIRVPDPNGYGTRSVPFNQHCQQIGNQTFCN